MKTLRYFFYLVIVGILLSLAVINSQMATVHYYWGEAALPLSLLMLLVLCLGCFLGLLLSLGPLLKLRKERSHWRTEAKHKEKQMTTAARGS